MPSFWKLGKKRQTTHMGTRDQPGLKGFNNLRLISFAALQHQAHSTDRVRNCNWMKKSICSSLGVQKITIPFAKDYSVFSLWKRAWVGNASIGTVRWIEWCGNDCSFPTPFDAQMKRNACVVSNNIDQSYFVFVMYFDALCRCVPSSSPGLFAPVDEISRKELF